MVDDFIDRHLQDLKQTNKKSINEFFKAHYGLEPSSIGVAGQKPVKAKETVSNEVLGTGVGVVFEHVADNADSMIEVISLRNENAILKKKIKEYEDMYR